MTRVWSLGVVLGAVATLAGGPADAQTQTAVAPQPPLIIAPQLPPATRLEGFTAPVGALLTIGHDRMGEVAGIVVEAREERDSLGGRARGVVVTVPASREPQQAFVDEDELPGLLKGFDELLAMTGNPTVFRNFETSYATRGELVITASTVRTSGIVYSVMAGRLVKAEESPLDVGQMSQLRTLLEAAAQRLATLPPDK